jgi:hypothetical protein
MECLSNECIAGTTTRRGDMHHSASAFLTLATYPIVFTSRLDPFNFQPSSFTTYLHLLLFSPSVPIMSTSNQIAGPSRLNHNFAAIFQAAESEYEIVTGNPLHTHPFATQLDACHTPEAVSNVFRTQAQVLSKSRKRDERLMTWLDPTVHILFTFSGTLGEGIGLVSCFIRPM